jgi:hypothetical protein
MTDATSLIAKMRRARETWIDVGDFKFHVKRPTDTQANSMKEISSQDVCKQFVIGWDNVREIDIFHSGDPVPADFSPELWAEWVDDRPDFWEPIVSAVIDAYIKHRTASDEALKN